MLLMAMMLVAGTVAWAAAVVLSDAWGRSQIDLVERFAGGDADRQWPYLDAVDRTEAVCVTRTGCVQAVGNEYLTLLKFGSVDGARQYAKARGAASVQVDPLVIDFDGRQLSPQVRQEIVDVVSGINVSSPD